MTNSEVSSHIAQCTSSQKKDGWICRLGGDAEYNKKCIGTDFYLEGGQYSFIRKLCLLPSSLFLLLALEAALFKKAPLLLLVSIM